MVRQSHSHLYRYFITFLLGLSLVMSTRALMQDELDLVVDETNETFVAPMIIKDIIIHGTRQVSPQTILTKTPYRVGTVFRSNKTRKLIHSLFDLGYFEQVQVFIEPIDTEHVTVHIHVKEKDKVEGFEFEGNSSLSRDEIEKKINLSSIKTIDEAGVAHVVDQLKKLYQEKNYHNVTITTSLIQTGEGRVKVLFSITEGETSLVKRVMFEGNCHFPSKKLASLLFTREDWLIGFLYRAGVYHPDAVEYDKHVIENFYHSNGFLTAQVTEVNVIPNPEICGLDVTFVIDEGDIYTIGEIETDDTCLLTKEQILQLIQLRPGQLYSKERIQNTLESLRMLWGNHGYLFADVQPSVRPNRETKKVDLSFMHELGNPVKLRRMTITGNRKTRSGVIYRNLLFTEDELLTSAHLEQSKEHIQRLGYFDQRNGVNWKIIPVDDEYADIELILKEVKTGKLFFQMGFGGADIQSPSKGFRISGTMADSNFVGTGIAYSLVGSWASDDRSVIFSVSNPWLFDRPILGALNVEHRKTTYDDLTNVSVPPTENLTSGSGTIGFLIPKLNFARFTADFGGERIIFNPRAVASLPFADIAFQDLYQVTLNRRFQSGNAIWVGLSLNQDMRNHPVYTSRGYMWLLSATTALPVAQETFGYVKVEGDAHWYTPLINEHDLVLHLHGHFGMIESLKGKPIPYRELYHIGGPATVRGYLFGQIGPSIFGDSIGGTKAFWVNAEVVFPMTTDFGLRGLFFYDGGSGWDTPDAHCIDPRILRNNKFNYRHAVGFGIRLTNPTPMCIDWGFKLDRNKKRKESFYEVHFTMSHDF